MPTVNSLPKVIFVAALLLVPAPFSVLSGYADEGEAIGDWEGRLKALEGRVGELEEENSDLRRQLELLKVEREARGLPSGLPEKVAGLEERVGKVEKGLPQIQVGHGALKVGGLIQGWALYDRDGNDRFRLRRTEIRLSGKVAESEPIEYTIMIDPAQVTEESSSRDSLLQDAYVSLGYLPHHTLDIGQYKPGIGEEGSRSSAKLDTVERAFISRTFGDQRDIGARLSGKWPSLDYAIGLFNGSGQNQADANDQKDVAGRVVLRPFQTVSPLKGLAVGLSGYHRSAHGSTFAKKRLGYEARYEYKDFSLKGEYFSGQGTASSSSTTENRTLANGWYGQAGYFFCPKLQGVLRHEGYDPNEEAAGDKVQETTLGLNYFIDSYYAKLQLNYIHKDEETDEIGNDQLIGALQVAF